MIGDVAYLQHEHERTRESMKQVIEEYIHGNPEMPMFCFFLASTQDLGMIKQAMARASLSTGKPIDLIYPVGIPWKEQEE